jgi:hypothetical protein
VQEKRTTFEREKHKCYIIREKPTATKEGTRTSTAKFKTTKSPHHHLLGLFKKKSHLIHLLCPHSKHFKKIHFNQTV